MEHQALLSASKSIVAQNITDNVSVAKVHWNADASHLALVFAYDSKPTQDDLEWQELAMAELLAEFHDIVTAECLSLPSNSRESETGLVVYRRNG